MEPLITGGTERSPPPVWLSPLGATVSPGSGELAHVWHVLRACLCCVRARGCTWGGPGGTVSVHTRVQGSRGGGCEAARVGGTRARWMQVPDTEAGTWGPRIWGWGVLSAGWVRR